MGGQSSPQHALGNWKEFPVDDRRRQVEAESQPGVEAHRNGSNGGGQGLRRRGATSPSER